MIIYVLSPYFCRRTATVRTVNFINYEEFYQNPLEGLGGRNDGIGRFDPILQQNSFRKCPGLLKLEFLFPGLYTIYG